LIHNEIEYGDCLCTKDNGYTVENSVIEVMDTLEIVGKNSEQH